MFRNMIKTLWNSRRSYRMLMIEQLLVFVVLVICFMSLFDMLGRYRDPGLLDTDDTVFFSMLIMPGTMSGAGVVESNSAFSAVLDNVRQWEQVEYITETSSFVPYLRSTEYYTKDTVRIAGVGFGVHHKYAEQDAQQVFKIKMTEGTWLPETEGETPPVVISQPLADEIDCVGSPIGLTLQDSRNNTYKISGIFPGIKEEPFTPAVPAVVYPVSSRGFLGPYYREVAFRIAPGTFSEFSMRLYNECRRLIPHFEKIDVGIHEVDEYKSKAMFPVTSRLKLMFLPTVILMLFAFVGTFGLLMLDVRRRASEYSLMRALGATRVSLMKTVLLQSILITVISVFPGIILILTVSGVTSESLLAIAFAVVLMGFFSFASSLYPAWKISMVEPATILREE